MDKATYKEVKALNGRQKMQRHAHSHYLGVLKKTQPNQLENISRGPNAVPCRSGDCSFSLLAPMCLAYMMLWVMFS